MEIELLSKQLEEISLVISFNFHEIKKEAYYLLLKCSFTWIMMLFVRLSKYFKLTKLCESMNLRYPCRCSNEKDNQYEQGNSQIYNFS